MCALYLGAQLQLQPASGEVRVVLGATGMAQQRLQQVAEELQDCAELCVAASVEVPQQLEDDVCCAREVDVWVSEVLPQLVDHGAQHRITLIQGSLKVACMDGDEVSTCNQHADARDGVLLWLHQAPVGQQHNLWPRGLNASTGG